MLSRLLALPVVLAAVYAKHRLVCRLAFAGVLLLVVAFTVARYISKASKPSEANTLTRTAFLRWRPQILGLERGENIYIKHNYPNPPIMAMVLWPFTALPPVEGGVLWLLLKVGMASAMMVWAFRLSGPMPEPAKLLAVVLAAHPIIGDLNHGNVNIFILFLVFAALELYRRGADILAGIFLALAISCKVTPALFLPYFGWKAFLAYFRADAALQSRIAAFWQSGGRLLCSAVLGLSLFLLFVPATLLAVRTPTVPDTEEAGWKVPRPESGWDENLVLLQDWFNGMVRPFLIDGQVTSIHANQSIPGVVNRLLVEEPSDVDFDEETGVARPKEYHNFTDIGAPAARRIVQGFQALFVLAVVLLCRSPQRGGLATAAECALVVMGMLLFSERTWKHHGTGLILPVAVILGLWSSAACGQRTKLLLGLLLLLVTDLTLVPSLLGGRAQDLALTYGSHLASYLLMTVAVVVVLWQTKSNPASKAISPSG